MGTHDDEGFNQLTGVELGNLWFTLDNCEFLYFDVTQKPHPKPTKTQINQIKFALHLATHHYIRSLEKAIMQLPEAMRQQALSDLSHISGAVPENSSDELSPWSPLAQEQECATILNQKSRDQQLTDDQKKKMIEKCAAAIEKQPKGPNKRDKTKPQ